MIIAALDDWYHLLHGASQQRTFCGSVGLNDDLSARHGEHDKEKYRGLIDHAGQVVESFFLLPIEFVLLLGRVGLCRVHTLDTTTLRRVGLCRVHTL